MSPGLVMTQGDTSPSAETADDDTRPASAG